MSHAQHVLQALKISTTINVPLLTCLDCERKYSLLELKGNQYSYMLERPAYCPFCGSQPDSSDSVVDEVEALLKKQQS